MKEVSKYHTVTENIIKTYPIQNNEINYKELQVLQFKYNILQNTENINDTKLQNKYIPEISKKKVHYI